jgi:hypothetical protein
MPIGKWCYPFYTWEVTDKKMKGDLRNKYPWKRHIPCSSIKRADMNKRVL